MTCTSRIFLIGLAVLVSGCNGTTNTNTDPNSDPNSESVDVTRYSKPKDDETLLVDDRIEDKKTTFDPTLIDRRPLNGWSMNASDAVIRLDTPLVKPDWNPEQLVLHPGYASAIKEAKGTVLPSVNLIDGKAKQFDDGLYAAIDQAYFLGHGESMKSHLETLRRIREKVAKGSPADDYLAAGLSLAGKASDISPTAKSIANQFLSSEIRSKPIGFYTWNPTLTDTFRVLRFFAQTIDNPSIPVEIARVLKGDEALRNDYIKAYLFYAAMTNPLIGSTPADLIGGGPTLPADEPISLFPRSTSREVKLFEELFPKGLPPGANLMRELVTAIRSGKVDLEPRPNSGWYEYQAYALETLLLPEKGAEANKLLLTKAYKKRMLEAFQALITKRRETHVRQLMEAKSEAPGPIEELASVEPRLRVEPNPTYYLRTARSYRFLANFLKLTLGEETLKSIKGLREGGERDKDLLTELAWMRSLFYGLYLLSAEDIGMKVEFPEGEPVDRDASEKLATEWLATIGTDPDLAVDTRVSVPIYHNQKTGTVRLWMTIGVRLTALEASYLKPPSLRPLEGPGEWKAVEPYKLYTTGFLIPVDEFAEVEIRGNRVLNRAELRAICDKMKTKQKIIEAIQK